MTLIQSRTVLKNDKTLQEIWFICENKQRAEMTRMGWKRVPPRRTPYAMESSGFFCFNGSTDYAVTMIPIETMMTSCNMKEEGSCESNNMLQSSTQTLCWTAVLCLKKTAPCRRDESNKYRRAGFGNTTTRTFNQVTSKTHNLENGLCISLFFKNTDRIFIKEVSWWTTTTRVSMRHAFKATRM